MQNGKTNVLAEIIKQWGKDVETNLRNADTEKRKRMPKRSKLPLKFDSSCLSFLGS